MVISIAAVAQHNTTIDALTASANYANAVADNANDVVKAVISVYPNIQKKSAWPKYVCPTQLDDYYYTKALPLVKSLPPNGVLNALQALRKAEQQLDKSCKSLDTYYKLEDYKTDSFQHARELVTEIQVAVSFVKDASAEVDRAIQAARQGTTLQTAETKMMTVISSERRLLDQWKFNLEEQTPTEWPIEKIRQSIAQDQRMMEQMKAGTSSLKYPASSMYSQFADALASIIEVKNRAIDDFNNEARKSDRHANAVYLELINYCNGTLIADFNAFAQYAKADGNTTVPALKYISSFEIRAEAKVVRQAITPFKDVVHTPVAVHAETSVIPLPAFDALVKYLEFINETWRQTNYMQLVLRNFAGSANYHRTAEDFKKRAGMSFDYKDYKLPQSSFDDVIRTSKSLPPDYANHLNAQATVLLDILRELDELGAAIETEVAARKYEEDRLANIFAMLDRSKVLFDTWDVKKEILYGDVRSIYDSFKRPTSDPSWERSGSALRHLTDLDHELLFQIKQFYKGDETVRPETGSLDESVRDVIANEYEYMKGIQKIGRNNGLCPYTPYEDLPETSRRLSDASRKLKPAGTLTGYSHPYYQFVYLYNDIVDDYNKFCELSKSVLHLPAVKQPELFVLPTPNPVKTDTSTPVAITKTESHNVQATGEKTEPVSATTKIERDTVVIVKRDTVYLPAEEENVRSLEGYATNNLFLLLDVSGSMNQPDKLPLLKQSMLNLISMMRTEDRVSIITFSSKPKVVLKPTSFKEEEKLKDAIDKLTSSGKTDANAALRFVYKVADQNYLRGGSNRIVLATDGDFVISEEVSELISKFADNDIFLSVFNFGKGMGASKNLEDLAKKGGGNFRAVSKGNVELNLIREVKAKRVR